MWTYTKSKIVKVKNKISKSSKYLTALRNLPLFKTQIRFVIDTQYG